MHFSETAANLPALGFYCCGSDSIGPVGRDGWLLEGAASYEISMGSGEALITRRLAASMGAHYTTGKMSAAVPKVVVAPANDPHTGEIIET